MLHKELLHIPPHLQSREPTVFRVSHRMGLKVSSVTGTGQSVLNLASGTDQTSTASSMMLGTRWEAYRL